jgi:hypothetical protein
MASLQSQELASSFTDALLQAVRNASIRDLQSTSNNARNGRAAAAAARPASPRSSRRLPRRSAEDIAKELGRVVGLVKTHKTGLRAEQIRGRLGMQPKEMPRILKEGLSKKALRSKGQKRATTYFAVRPGKS